MADPEQCRRELLTQVAARDREADPARKTILLDAFVACTGYARMKFDRTLNGPFSLHQKRGQTRFTRLFSPKLNLSHASLGSAWVTAPALTLAEDGMSDTDNIQFAVMGG